MKTSIGAGDLDAEKTKLRSLTSPDRPLLVVTIGLPRSGKSTWSKLTGWPIISPDGVRLAFQGRPFIQDTEAWIWMIVRLMVKAMALAGNEVIVLDGTFVTNQNRQVWVGSEFWNTVFKIFPVDAEECKKRARADGRDDLIDVINRMTRQWEPLSLNAPCHPEAYKNWRPR